MVHKCCAHRLCKSDSRYPERLEGGVKFLPFPKPKTQLEKCKRWIKICGRPHDLINRITKDTYICTKHFNDISGPTKDFPDPSPADPYTSISKTQKPVRKPPLKRRRLMMESLDSNLSQDKESEEVPVKSASCQTDHVYILSSKCETLKFRKCQIDASYGSNPSSNVYPVMLVTNPSACTSAIDLVPCDPGNSSVSLLTHQNNFGSVIERPTTNRHNYSGIITSEKDNINTDNVVKNDKELIGILNIKREIENSVTDEINVKHEDFVGGNHLEEVEVTAHTDKCVSDDQFVMIKQRPKEINVKHEDFVGGILHEESEPTAYTDNCVSDGQFVIIKQEPTAYTDNCVSDDPFVIIKQEPTAYTDNCVSNDQFVVIKQEPIDPDEIDAGLETKEINVKHEDFVGGNLLEEVEVTANTDNCVSDDQFVIIKQESIDPDEIVPESNRFEMSGELSNQTSNSLTKHLDGTGISPSTCSRDSLLPSAETLSQTPTCQMTYCEPLVVAASSLAEPVKEEVSFDTEETLRTKQSTMDESLDVSGIELSFHARNECECGYSTQDRSNYNKHRRTCKTFPTPLKSTPTERRHFVCDQCGQNYKTAYGLSIHVKNKHREQFKHECSQCGKKFNQTLQYRYHCFTHLKVGLDKCQHCRKEFSSPGSLERHLKVCNTPSKQFKCDKCEASFAYKYGLTYHQKGKHQPPRYKCDQCGMQYGWRSSLKVHMKCHSH